MADPFIGEIKIVGFDYAPVGWALCDGAELAISQNVALFSIIGTTYGGDGTTKFNLPDIRGRVPVHAGRGADTITYSVGQKAGAETVALTVETMPMHNHALFTSSTAATSKSPANSVPAMTTTNLYATTTGNNNTVVNPNALASAGGGKAHENRMPYLALLYIIALEGVFPMRNVF